MTLLPRNCVFQHQVFRCCFLLRPPSPGCSLQRDGTQKWNPSPGVYSLRVWIKAGWPVVVSIFLFPPLLRKMVQFDKKNIAFSDGSVQPPPSWGWSKSPKDPSFFFEEIGGGETLHPRAEQRSSGWIGILGRGKHNLKGILEMEKKTGMFFIGFDCWSYSRMIEWELEFVFLGYSVLNAHGRFGSKVCFPGCSKYRCLEPCLEPIWPLFLCKWTFHFMGKIFQVSGPIWVLSWLRQSWKPSSQTWRHTRRGAQWNQTQLRVEFFHRELRLRRSLSKHEMRFSF